MSGVFIADMLQYLFHSLLRTTRYLQHVHFKVKRIIKDYFLEHFVHTSSVCGVLRQR